MAADVDVARRLRAARVLAGVETREELADLINLPKLGAKTLGKIERGERVLEEHEIPPVARALGVPISFFTSSFEPTVSGDQLDRIEAKLAKIEKLLTPRANGAVPDLGIPGLRALLEERLEELQQTAQPPAKHKSRRAAG